VGGQYRASAALLLHPLHRKMGRPQGWCGQVWKTLPTNGFESQTIQPVANHYTDCINPAH